MARNLKGQTALVTGASSGLGVSFARQLAERGVNLILVARRAERLTALAKELSKQHGVEVTSIPGDLSSRAGVDALLEKLGETNVDILINNAGAGIHALTHDIPWDHMAANIHLNTAAPTQLSRHFGERMCTRGSGYILNVASIGAYMPVPGFAIYGAAKAYLLSFSEALSHELRKTGVRVCCLSPGGTKTEFFEAAGQKLSPTMRLALMSSERCARIGLRGLFGWRRALVSGYSNKLMIFMLRFVPRRLIVGIAALVMGKPDDKAKPE